MSLNNIRESVQEVAEAISEVLKVGVTIIDDEFNRIAATGRYKKFIGKKIPAKCLFEKIMKEKKPLFQLRDDKFSKLEDSACVNCSAKDTCIEIATVGYPIMKDNEIIGIIGINIFDEDRLELLHKEFDSTVAFLNKLSTLLVGNIIYRESIRILEIQREETNHFIDGISYGILCVDNKGNIKYINKTAENILKIKRKDKNNCKNITEVIKDFNLSWLLEETGENRKTISEKDLLVKINPVEVKGKIVSTIIEISKKSEELRDAYKLIGRSKVVRFEDIIGNSAAMTAVKSLSKSIASTDSTVILRGQSGTGKELFARSIHFESNRCDAPFIAINCASIPDNLLESELFGYEGGAFTGARKEGQIGKFELASGGTIFLDEIGELPLHLQPKILRVLQEHSFIRIGGREEVQVDVRIVAATHRNLEEMVSNGTFREDLYYRLNVIPIHLPELRYREEDIFLLSKFLLEKFCFKYSLEKKLMSEEVRECFRSYPWPGNIRELENAIEYMVNISKGNIIYKDTLPVAIKNYFEDNKVVEFTIEKGGLKDRVDAYEKNLLLELLRNYGESTEGRTLMAKELKIDLSTLYRKLKKYNLQK